jgi:hypothetical protein
LQEHLLASLIGPILSSLWVTILIGRPYRNGPFNDDLYYAVGQPMGALSSWAMLALTHHMILQHISVSLGNRRDVWEDRYEVLGDDIIIFDSALAHKYLDYMSQLGVPINTYKSVVSTRAPVVEYAKRTAIGIQDVSPVSWKMFIKQDSFAGRLSIVSYFWNKGLIDHPIALYRVIIGAALWDKRPLKDKLSSLGILSTLVQSGKIPLDWVLRVLHNSRSIYFRPGKSVNFTYFPIPEMERVISKAVKGQDLTSVEPFRSMSYTREVRWYRLVLASRARAIIDRYSDSEIDKCLSATADIICNRHRSLMVESFLHDLSEDHVLAIKFYREMELDMASMSYLTQVLKEVESANSFFLLANRLNKDRTVKTQSPLRILSMISKSLTRVRDDRRGLEAGWVRIGS